MLGNTANTSTLWKLVLMHCGSYFKVLIVIRVVGSDNTATLDYFLSTEFLLQSYVLTAQYEFSGRYSVICAKPRVTISSVQMPIKQCNVTCFHCMTVLQFHLVQFPISFPLKNVHKQCFKYIRDISKYTFKRSKFKLWKINTFDTFLKRYKLSLSTCSVICARLVKYFFIPFEMFKIN